MSFLFAIFLFSRTLSYLDLRLQHHISGRLLYIAPIAVANGRLLTAAPGHHHSSPIHNHSIVIIVVVFLIRCFESHKLLLMLLLSVEMRSWLLLVTICWMVLDDRSDGAFIVVMPRLFTAFTIKECEYASDLLIRYFLYFDLVTPLHAAYIKLFLFGMNGVGTVVSSHCGDWVALSI